MVSTNDDIASEDTHLIDFKLIPHLVAYVFGSIGRHKPLVLSLFVLICGATVSSLFLLPKTYHVETRLLAQRISALSLKGNQDDAPGRSAVETVMRRENLVAIVRQTNLVHQWYNHRAPLPHLKDLLVQAIGKPESEHETIEWMADVLAKRISVTTPSDGIIDIEIDWPDPSMAFHLVDAAQQNYLEARQASEITAIAEQVAIFQNHAASLRTDIDTAVEAIEKVRAERLAKPEATAASSATASAEGSPRLPPTMSAPQPHRPSDPDPELARLKVTIEAKQVAINDLEEFRRRRLLELNASLAEKRAMYTDNHPTIIDLRQTIASFSTESPQVQSLRADIERLQRQLDSMNAAVGAESRVFPVINAAGAVSAPPPLPGSIIRIEQESSDERDPAMMYARAQLRDAMDKYSSLRAQIEASQIDFDTAEAAFKYRYSVIDPPIEPKKAAKPSPVAVALAAVIGGLVVAVFAAVALDVRRGRFLARWQVERALELPTLAEIDDATLALHRME
jgi:uncharacterized protein involved in exopolysaccharide biosynthesis